jgi:hypothetical protein
METITLRRQAIKRPNASRSKSQKGFDADAELTTCRNSSDQNQSCGELGYTAISSSQTWSTLSRHAGQNQSGANSACTMSIVKAAV